MNTSEIQNTVQKENGNELSRRNGEIDFLKFTAAICILLYHSTHLDSSDPHEHLQGLTFYVELFFILSGMFMAQHAASQKKQAGGRSADGTGRYLSASLSFIRKRFFRLAPEYYAGMLIAWVIDLFDRNVGLSYNLSLTITSLDQIFMIHSARDSYQTADPATWYISALLIGCAILYPLLLFLGTWFTHYIAPLTAVLIWGLSYRLSGSILNMYMPLRAVMGLCCGITAWTISCKLMKMNFTTLTRRLFTIVWMGANVCAIGMLAWKPDQLQWDAVVLFMVIAFISFAGVGSLHSVFQIPGINSVCARLGAFSYCLYLANNAWSWEVPQMFPGKSYHELLVWYLVLSFCTAAAIDFIGRGVRVFWKKHGRRLFFMG